GYTDNIPIHTRRFNSNWELSTARASSLVDLFIRVYHIAPQRLSAAGYGQYRPIASNATLPGRQLNRRVDLVVVSMEAARALQSAPPATNSTGWGRQGLWPNGKPGAPNGH
ncbi:MAG: OmpA/MotB family protein, partial [Terriglobales bacterium]